MLTPMRNPVPLPRNPSAGPLFPAHPARVGKDPGTVLFISTYNIQCGLATYTENLAAALAARHGPVAVLANKVLPTYSDTGHGRCEYVRCWDRITCHFDGLKAEMTRRAPRVVHIQFEYGLFAAGYTSLLEFLDWLHGRHIAIVLTPHSVIKRPDYFAGLAGLLRRHLIWFRDVLRKVDAVIVHTALMKGALRAWGCPESRIEIIPHGIETVERVSPIEARTALGLPLDKKIILSFGLITRCKNLHANVRIIAGLSKRFPDLHYLIAGFPQAGANRANAIYADRLVRQVADHRNMSIDVSFIPHDRIKYYLCAADIYLLNYAQTPASASGNACLAIAYGIPSVASRSNLLDEMPDEVCLRVDVNAPRQVAEALARLLADPELGHTLRERALALAPTRSWDKVAALHVQLYDKVVAGPGGYPAVPCTGK